MASKKRDDKQRLGPAGRVVAAILLTGVLLTAMGRAFMMAGTPEILGSGVVQISDCRRTELVLQICRGTVVQWQSENRDIGSFIQVLSYTPLSGEVAVVVRDRWVSHYEGEDEVFETERVVVPEGLWMPTRWQRNFILVPTLFAFMATATLAGQTIQHWLNRRELRGTD